MSSPNVWMSFGHSCSHMQARSNSLKLLVDLSNERGIRWKASNGWVESIPMVWMTDTEIGLFLSFLRFWVWHVCQKCWSSTCTNQRCSQLRSSVPCRHKLDRIKRPWDYNDMPQRESQTSKKSASLCNTKRERERERENPYSFIFHLSFRATKYVCV